MAHLSTHHLAGPAAAAAGGEAAAPKDRGAVRGGAAAPAGRAQGGARQGVLACGSSLVGHVRSKTVVLSVGRSAAPSVGALLPWRSGNLSPPWRDAQPGLTDCLPASLLVRATAQAQERLAQAEGQLAQQAVQLAEHAGVAAELTDHKVRPASLNQRIDPARIDPALPPRIFDPPPHPSTTRVTRPRRPRRRAWLPPARRPPPCAPSCGASRPSSTRARPRGTRWRSRWRSSPRPWRRHRPTEPPRRSVV